MTNSTHEIADAIRNVTARMQRAIDEGHRPRRVDAEDLLEVLLALADEIDPPFAEMVDPQDACPQCGERFADRLLGQTDGHVHCAGCGQCFRPGRSDR